eukprot:SM000131S26687  [mRNA]  locus=s131:44222:46862:+ [translate_table: standard]
MAAPSPAPAGSASGAIPKLAPAWRCLKAATPSPWAAAAELVWPRPGPEAHAALVKGLAASLRVSDAISAIGDLRRRGLPQRDEVGYCCPGSLSLTSIAPPFTRGVAKAHVTAPPMAGAIRKGGEYELLSGDVVTSTSEPISGDMSVLERGLRFLRSWGRAQPTVVHSLVVRAPNGVARAVRFATASPDVPAGEGERVTLACAAPKVARQGWKSTRTPGRRPGEPMALLCHATGEESVLLRPPARAGSGAALDSSMAVPLVLLLGAGDAATGLLDPALPRLLAISVASTALAGSAFNLWLPERTAEAAAVRQQLLQQHDFLAGRLLSLTQEAADEVRMLARMCQLQKKMEAMADPATYSARLGRVTNARKGLEERLSARLDLIDSYAKVEAMIEIEVEMDLDVIAAEAAGAPANIAEQIERLMEVESLQQEWRQQAEASDELERLLRSAPPVEVLQAK